MVIVRGYLTLPFSSGTMGSLEIETYNLYDECREDIDYRLTSCEYGDVYGGLDDKYADDEDLLDYLSRAIIWNPRINHIEVEDRDEWGVDVAYHLDVDVDYYYDLYKKGIGR